MYLITVAGLAVTLKIGLGTFLIRPLGLKTGQWLYKLSPIKRRPWSILADGEGSNQAGARSQRAAA